VNGIPNVVQPPSNAWHNCRKLIHVPKSAQKGFPMGFWPIPESYWPENTMNSLVFNINYYHMYCINLTYILRLNKYNVCYYSPQDVLIQQLSFPVSTKNLW